MAKAFEALPDTSPVPLCETTGCKWPIGEERPFYFCNAALASIDVSYCTAHRRIGVTPAMVRKRGLSNGVRL